jgi:hypothetical protein
LGNALYPPSLQDRGDQRGPEDQGAPPWASICVPMLERHSLGLQRLFLSKIYLLPPPPYYPDWTLNSRMLHLPAIFISALEYLVAKSGCHLAVSHCQTSAFSCRRVILSRQATPPQSSKLHCYPSAVWTRVAPMPSLSDCLSDKVVTLVSQDDISPR